jgi:hypothetical protein
MTIQRSPFGFLVMVSLVTTVSLSSGCSWPLKPGAFEGAAPPRLVTIEGVVGWDNPSAFGPVPSELQATGDSICATINTRWKTYHAQGYHSKAQDLDGTTFDRGGYYCE